MALACDCVLELVVCRVRFARVFAPVSRANLPQILMRGVRDSLRSSISHHSPFCFPRTTNGDDATTPVLLWSVSGICINSSVFLPRGSGHVRSRSPETPPPSSHDRTGTGLCVL